MTYTKNLLKERILKFLANENEPTQLLEMVVDYKVQNYYETTEEVNVLIGIDACPFLQALELTESDVYRSIASYFPDTNQEEMMRHIAKCKDELLQLMISVCNIYEKVQPSVIRKLQEDVVVYKNRE